MGKALDPLSVSPSQETEDQLIATAQQAVSQCRWVVGECAAKWTARYARGRTDADFAALVGLTADQVYQRRRVWETFGERREEFAELTWSHFYAALTWDDAAECLRWAIDMQATVAEMRAWRRAQRGEDLTTAEQTDEAVRYLPTELEAVQAPGDARPEGGAGASRDAARSGSTGGAPAVAAGVARQSGDDDAYAPFRADAGSVPPAGGHPERPAPGSVTPEQVAKRLAAAFERCASALTGEFLRELRRLPEPVRNRFYKSARELQARLAELQ